MKSASDLSKAVWAAAVGVGVTLVGHSQAQTAAGELPAMHMVNLSQETVAAILERDDRDPRAAAAGSGAGGRSWPRRWRSWPRPHRDTSSSPTDAKHLNPRSTRWPQAKLEAMISIYDEAVLNHYTAERPASAASRDGPRPSGSPRTTQSWSSTSRATHTERRPERPGRARAPTVITLHTADLGPLRGASSW